MPTDPSQVDCSKFRGRKLSICEGTSGLPEATRQAYLRRWAGIPDPPRGLGDTVAAIIKAVTFGLVQPTPDCGCERRRTWLNRLFPYGTGGTDGVK